MTQPARIVLVFVLLCAVCSPISGTAASVSARDTVTPPPAEGPEACRRCIVITEQATAAIDIVDVAQGGKTRWHWSARQSNINPEDVRWFSNPDDAKPVYGGRYLLINASGGGVALVRIADKRAVFYAYAGLNPHSSELLFDGNIVTASSTDNRLVIFHVDTLGPPGGGYRKVIPMPFAHNVVWDRRRRVLWSAAEGMLYKLGYNGDCAHPDLDFLDSIPLPGAGSHDLFPVYGRDSLLLTNSRGAYYVNMQTAAVSAVKLYHKKGVKSLSSGRAGWPMLVMVPREGWWSDEVTDTEGHVVYQRPGLKIYKARWFLPNSFSYPPDASFKQCNPGR